MVKGLGRGTYGLGLEGPGLGLGLEILALTTSLLILLKFLQCDTGVWVKKAIRPVKDTASASTKFSFGSLQGRGLTWSNL